MEQVCGALAEAHGIGLVHRDIKPANIFCAYRGGVFDVIKLLDFGLAKPTMEKGQDAQLTLAGTITGSPLFMSPEQASGEDGIDARSDIYSLGAVMYYMLTGQPPFMSENPLKVMIAHASQEVVPPRQHQSGIAGRVGRNRAALPGKGPRSSLPGCGVAPQRAPRTCAGRCLVERSGRQMVELQRLPRAKEASRRGGGSGRRMIFAAQHPVELARRMPGLRIIGRGGV